MSQFQKALAAVALVVALVGVPTATAWAAARPNAAPRAAQPGVTAPTEKTLMSAGTDLGLAVAGVGSVYTANPDVDAVYDVSSGAGNLGPVAVTGLDGPGWVASDAAGDLYVLNGNGQVTERATGGTQTSVQFSVPLSQIGVDTAGDIYGIDPTAHHLLEIPKGGSQVTIGTFSATNEPLALAVDGAGDVFVSVASITTDSNTVEELPKVGTAHTLGFGTLHNPFAVAVDSTGDVFVGDSSNGKVYESPTTGTLQTLPLTVPLDEVNGLAVDGAGTVFALGSSDHIISLAKNATTQTQLEFTDLSEPGGVVADASGAFIVADTGNQRVVKVTQAGVASTLGFTGLSSPVAVGEDGAGDVYVLDTLHDQVFELPPSGPQTTLGFSGLTDATDLAVDSGGDVFVSDSVGVTELPKGGTQRTLGFAASEPAGAVAVDGLGDVFESQINQYGNYELTPGGKLTPIGAADKASGLAVSGGNVYLSDVAGDDVAELATNGAVSELPFAGTNQRVLGTSGIYAPTGVAVNAAGDVAAVDEQAGLVELVPPAPLSVPTGVTATTGVGQATVSWSAPGTGPAPTGYVVTPYVGTTAQAAHTFTTNARTQVISGLTTGTAYTFTVSAVVSGVTGAVSDPSASLTVGTPGAPGFVSAVAGTTTAVVRWLQPSGPWSPVTGYVVTVWASGSLVATQTFTTAATSDTVTGLQQDATYNFTVAAVNTFGTGSPSALSSPIVEGSPGAPSLQSATPGNGTAKVQWWPGAANESPITGYVITPVQGTTALPAETFTTAASSDTVTGLTNGVTYTFLVAATNVSETGTQSAPTAPIVVGTPAAPVLQSATPGNGIAKVQWWPESGNGAAVSGYVITPYVGTVAQPAQTFTTAASSDTVTGLTNGTSYTFKIAAVNEFGPGTQSAATAPVTVGVPAAPAGLQSASPGNGTARVAWWPGSADGSPITGYVITPYIGATAQAAETFSTTADPETVTGLTNGVAYTFRIAAVNSFGVGTQSPATASIVVGTPAAPAAPTAAGGSKQATVSWAAPAANASALTGYVVTPYRAGAAQAPVTLSSTATSDVVSGLASGVSYTFTVAAVNGSGTGPASPQSNAVTPT